MRTMTSFAPHFGQIVSSAAASESQLGQKTLTAGSIDRTGKF
jgi:hypothetical protein